MGYPKRAHPEVCVPPSRRPCDRLWYLMTREGVTSAQLARRLGVMPESVRRYVSGEQDMRAWQIIEVCNYFGVSADFLLGLSDVEGRKNYEQKGTTG
jgi:plasmid maintenance system antidote protein VapI